MVSIAVLNFLLISHRRVVFVRVINVIICSSCSVICICLLLVLSSFHLSKSLILSIFFLSLSDENDTDENCNKDDREEPLPVFCHQKESK